MANWDNHSAAACFFGFDSARFDIQRPIGSLSRSNAHASRIRYGTMCRKTDSLVCSNRIAPVNPPKSDGRERIQTRARFSVSCRRYAHELVTEPGQMATVLVALAVIEDMPLYSRAGNVSSVPPPATALTKPAPNAASRLTQ